MKTISVSIICKNEEAVIAKCLESVKGADEIIVSDTGSSDKTVEIAKRYTDKVYTEYKWKDNFADARNFALSKCTGDWILSIDCDEYLEEGGMEKIRELIKNTDKRVFSLKLISEGSGAMHYLSRLFKRDGAKWEGIGHEHINFTEKNHTDIQVTYGYSPAHNLDKDRMFRIMSNAMRENPSGRNAYYLGREYFYRKDYPMAIWYMNRCIELSKWAPEISEAYLMAAKSYWFLSEGNKARELCLYAIKMNPAFKEALEFMAELHYEPYKSKWSRLARAADNEEVLFIRKKAQKQPSNSHQKGKPMEDMFFFLVDILEKEGMDYWLDGGTLLGAVREQGFVPNDDDADVSIYYEEWDRIIKHQKEFNDNGYTILRKTNGTGVMVRTEDAIKNFGKADESVKDKADVLMHIDIFNWKNDNGTLRRPFSHINRNKGNDFPADWVKKLTRTRFKGKMLKIPHRSEELLEYRYGSNWRTPMTHKQFDIMKEGKIPKIIHQIWLGKAPIPEEWMKTVREMYSDWKYMLWTEDNLPTLYNKDIYDKEDRFHTKSNLIRYEVVNKYGGIHIDSDMTALKKIPDSFLEDSFFSAYESEKWTGDLVPSALFGATPNHPILDYLIKNMKNQDQSLESWKFNGTQYFTDVVKMFKGKVYPSEMFHPQHFRDEECDPERLKKAYTFHHWGTTNKIWKTTRM